MGNSVLLCLKEYWFKQFTVPTNRQRNKSIPETCTSPRCARCYLLCHQICTWHHLQQLLHETAAQMELESRDLESQWTRFVYQGHSSVDHSAGYCQPPLRTHRDGDQMPPWCGHSDVPVEAGHSAVCALSKSASN